MGLKARAAKHTTIDAFIDSHGAVEKGIFRALRREIDKHLPEAESKIWHAHPVWFLDENPIVGFGKLKDGVRLLFWSGQSFKDTGLEQTGSFKAAEVRFTAQAQIDKVALKAWLVSSREIQWDYKNIVKRRGKLVRL